MTNYYIIATGITNPENALKIVEEGEGVLLNPEPLNLIHTKGDERVTNSALSELIDWKKTLQSIPGEFACVHSFMGDGKLVGRGNASKETWIQDAEKFMKSVTHYIVRIHEVASPK